MGFAPCKPHGKATPTARLFVEFGRLCTVQTLFATRLVAPAAYAEYCATV